MSSRKPGYVIGVALLAILFSLPQVLLTVEFGSDAARNRNWRHLLPRIPGITQQVAYYGDSVSSSPLWHDQFVHFRVYQVTSKNNWNWMVYGVNPQTGEQASLKIEINPSTLQGMEPMALGDRLWFVGYGNSESFEIVDGVAKLSDFVRPRGWNLPRFLWNGEPAYVERGPNGFVLSTFTSGMWKVAGTVVLPELDRLRSLGGEEISFAHADSMECLNDGDRLHVILHTKGRLLYREGLELNVAPKTAWGGNLSDEPANALRPANTDADMAGWSLACSRPENLVSAMWGSMPRPYYVLLIQKQPAVFIAENRSTGNEIGHIYRFDGTNWGKFASQKLPFGSQRFNVVTLRDGTASYIVVTTSTGIAHVYAVDADGIHQTNGAAPAPSWQLFQDVIEYGGVFFGMLVLGILLGTGISGLMRWYTKPQYGCGLQTIKLASLGWRGFARLIDITVIILTTVGLGWLMTREIDWLSYFEALNLRFNDPDFDHPTFSIAVRVGAILASWLVVIVVTFITTQAFWGVTPGKWFCGLKTLRTSLRPCGFAHSLVREIILAVDCCNLLCWTPGLVSIALTEYRQRLGDIVADTIVVETRSLDRQSLT